MLDFLNSNICNQLFQENLNINGIYNAEIYIYGNYPFFRRYTHISYWQKCIEVPIYIQNKEVDLTSSGSYVNWDNGQFDISNYWTLKIWGRNFTPNKTICTLSNTLNYSIIVNYFTDTTNMWWGVSVRPQSWSYGYYIESDHIPIATSTEQIFLWLRRVNNIYQIQIENLG